MAILLVISEPTIDAVVSSWLVLERKLTGDNWGQQYVTLLKGQYKKTDTLPNNNEIAHQVDIDPGVAESSRTSITSHNASVYRLGRNFLDQVDGPPRICLSGIHHEPGISAIILVKFLKWLEEYIGL